MSRQWDQWLKNHKPYDLDDNTEAILAQSIDALLSLSLQTLTIEEVMSNYNVTEERAKIICLTANKMVSDIEDFLLDILGYNGSSR